VSRSRLRRLAKSILSRLRRLTGPRLGEARLLFGIAAAREAAATQAVVDAEQRTLELEHELTRTYAELLELRALHLLTHGRAADAGSRAGQIGDLHSLLREVARRNHGRPSLVTVVIPVYGKVDYTIRCLRSIAATWSDSLNPTIVVVDDASPDGSAAELIGIPNIELLSSRENRGFLRSSNRGAALADTKYLCFLNNDTEVKEGWLDWLVTAAEQEKKAGIVGSKLVYPDGTLQDAGSIIWSDASGWNVGRGQDPAMSEFNFRREVDYVSGASLLIATDLFREIGGFDDRYAPAYYEDADLCFEVRARGLQVLYEPHSEVVHYEGITSGTDLSSGAKRYQEINRPKFAEKWATVLPSHFAPSADNVPAAMQRTPKRATILVVDSYVPIYDREAGSNRLFKIICIMRDLGYHVAFMPDNYAAPEPYTQALRSLGVEVLHSRPDGPSQAKALAGVLARTDLVWICRPEVCEKYVSVAREIPGLPIVYDTVDLHFVRERRRAELEGDTDVKWRELQNRELAVATAVDAVVTVTTIEQAELRLHGIDPVFVVPTIHDPENLDGYGFEARSGIIFIGGYGHTPNVDAVEWLCNEIMPRVWERLPNLHVTLLGFNPPEAVKVLAGDRVSVPGFIADVAPYFEEARVFVAPLRYGAGMKGKIGQALAFGLPVVTTSIGVEGFDLTDRVSCLLADSAEAFAAAIVEAYEDSRLWRTRAAGAREVLRPVSSDAVRESIDALIETLIHGSSASPPPESEGAPEKAEVRAPVAVPKRTLILYGNCQADALAVLLRSDPTVSALYRIVYLPSFENHEASVSDLMQVSDVASAAILLEQYDPQPFPHRKTLPADCITVTFPSVDLMILWPLYAANPYNDPPSAEFPWGPFPYGDRAIIDCIDRGMQADDILEYYLSPEAAYLPNLEHLHRIETGRLAARDGKCEIKMAGFVFEWYRRERLFWASNHPAMPVLRELLKRLLERVSVDRPDLRDVDIDRTLDGWPPEGPLGFPRIPVHPGVAEFLELAWYQGPGSAEVFGFRNHPLRYEDYFREMITRSLIQREAAATNSINSPTSLRS
jgi:GT2 family glycosyltransferase